MLPDPGIQTESRKKSEREREREKESEREGRELPSDPLILGTKCRRLDHLERTTLVCKEGGSSVQGLRLKVLDLLLGTCRAQCLLWASASLCKMSIEIPAQCATGVRKIQTRGNSPAVLSPCPCRIPRAIFCSFNHGPIVTNASMTCQSSV